MIVHSADGRTWTRDGVILHDPDGLVPWPMKRGIPIILGSVAWSGTRYVAVGTEGVIAHSRDGRTWTWTIVRPDSDRFEFGFAAVAWVGSRFVAVGEDGMIVHSADGRSWGRADSGTSYDLNGVAWNGSRFVAVGGAGGLGQIVHSTDGRTWTRVGIGIEFNGVAWNGSRFVAVGADEDKSYIARMDVRGLMPTAVMNMVFSEKTFTEWHGVGVDSSPLARKDKSYIARMDVRGLMRTAEFRSRSIE